MMSRHSRLLFVRVFSSAVLALGASACERPRTPYVPDSSANAEDVGAQTRDAGEDVGSPRDAFVAPEDAGFDSNGPLHCGDGNLDPLEGEQCDDRNRVGTDGCDVRCRVEDGWSCPVPGMPCEECGDGAVDSSEACDDGGRATDDGCDAFCAVEPGWDCEWGDCVAAQCGDGLRAGIETCDDGNRRSGDGCSFRCAVERGFVCVTPGAPCRPSMCGDSAVEAQEQCDDGGMASMDGCSATCTLEAGWHCPRAGAGGCMRSTCGDGLVQGSETCDDGHTAPNDGCSASCALEPGWFCPIPDMPCARATCGNGALEGLEGCDDGGTMAGDGCSASCVVEPFYRCEGRSCRRIIEFVQIAEFPAPMAQPQAVHYDPGTRSFVAYGFNASQGNAEVCLDGTIVGRDTRPRYGIGGGLDGAAYDPFLDRFLFVQQSGRLTEVDRASATVVRTVDLSGVGTAGGIQVGDDGRIYVANHYEKAIKVFERMATMPTRTISAPTAGPYLDNLFVIPGERLIGYYNRPPGVALEQFGFHSIDDGHLVGRSTIPGVLFANGRPFPEHADGGEAAADGGFFLVCSEYLDNGDLDDGICQLFASRCSSNIECANRLPGTVCKLDAPIPYCYPPALARDDRYRVEVGSMDNALEVTRNDSVSDAVCRGEEVRVSSVGSGDRGGTITIDGDGLTLRYSPAPGFCGGTETFAYEADLGGVVDMATVYVLVACVCGDGVRQANEECDDANTTAGDGCDPYCRNENVCGDGIVGSGEECDDDNTEPGDGCSPRCTYEIF